MDSAKLSRYYPGMSPLEKYRHPEQYSLTIDIGNSNIKFGLFYLPERLLYRDSLVPYECLGIWRIPTLHPLMAENPAEVLKVEIEKNILPQWRPGIFPNKVLFCSVVPKLDRPLVESLKAVFIPPSDNHKPSFPSIQQVRPHPKMTLPTGRTMDLSTYPAEQLGADRFVNLAAARILYPDEAVLIIDLGTAATLDVMNAEGTYLGGIITPGFLTFSRILTTKTAQLTDIPLEIPPRILGNNTAECLQSGAILGYLGLLQSLTRQIEEEVMEPDMRIIATGGLAAVLQELHIASQISQQNVTLPLFQEVLPTLTLTGLLWCGNNF